jgi:antibiotic biosynthesis monooxygenase (ABM) superfamily enzyme
MAANTAGKTIEANRFWFFTQLFQFGIAALFTMLILVRHVTLLVLLHVSIRMTYDVIPADERMVAEWLDNGQSDT